MRRTLDQSESVYSATKTGKNFVTINDSITAEDSDLSYMLSDSKLNSSQSSRDIIRNYSVRKFSSRYWTIS